MSTFLLPVEPVDSLSDYLALHGGGAGLERARRLGPEATIEVITASGLRGRGGAGFPTGRKWSGIASRDSTTAYVVCNGAEGEPGTFKDRALMRAHPYQLVEGLIIAALAVDAAEAFVCLKANRPREIERVTTAIEEFQTADCAVTAP